MMSVYVCHFPSTLGALCPQLVSPSLPSPSVWDPGGGVLKGVSRVRGRLCKVRYGSDDVGVPASLSFLKCPLRRVEWAAVSDCRRTVDTKSTIPRSPSLGARPPRGAPETNPPCHPGRQTHSQSSRPSPVRPSGRRHYLDKTSRSSRADSSRSRVLLPPAAPEPPPGRSFSFSPLEDAAILSTGPRPEAAQLGSYEERRAPEAEVRVTEAGRGGAGWGGGGGKEARVTAPPMHLETHCGRRRHRMSHRGVLTSKPGRRARKQRHKAVRLPCALWFSSRNGRFNGS